MPLWIFSTIVSIYRDTESQAIPQSKVFLFTCHFLFGFQMWMNVKPPEFVVQEHVTTLSATTPVSALQTTCKWMGEITAWVSPGFPEPCKFGPHLQDQQLVLSVTLLIRPSAACHPFAIFVKASSLVNHKLDLSSPPCVGGWEFSLKCNVGKSQTTVS